VGSARVREQANDPFEDLLEVERGADRRDDLVEEAFFDRCCRLPGGDPSILLLERWEWKGCGGSTDQRGCGTIRM
jgi:hypothetical protein